MRLAWRDRPARPRPTALAYELLLAERLRGQGEERRPTTGPTSGTASKNVVVVDRDGAIVEEIANLKQQDGKDIVVHGSATLVQTLMQHDLVDRYRLLVYPVVVGKGKRLIEEGIPATLKLLESQSFGSGVVALVYEPDPK